MQYLFLNQMMILWFHYKKILLGISCFISCVDLIAGYGHDANCERVPLKGPRGSLKSPGYPYSYHNHTSCNWIIKKKPEEIVTINFIDLDIEGNDPCAHPPCCLNWVKLGDDNKQRLFCGQNKALPEPLLFNGTEVWVKFHTNLETKGGRGFQLTYFVGAGICSGSQIKCNNGIGCYPSHEKCNGLLYCADFSDELNCGRCPVNYSSCGLTSNYCYNPYVQHCNRVLDCPNGIDEVGCDAACDKKIMCNSGSGCYSLHERCDGVPQCQDDSDEKYCNSELCRSERGGFLCANNRCIREIWSCDRTNDCGDGSDERNNCLKNSVITAAVMGSLICGLLLVVAISCSCKLYALRNVGTAPSIRETPLSRLEREFMYREPPPSYAVAVGDPRAYYPDTISNPGPRRNSHRHGRRSRSHRQRSSLGLNRPPPIVEELSETFNTSIVNITRGAVLELDRQNSISSGEDFSRNSGSTLSTPESFSSPNVKDITSTVPPLNSNEQSTSQNIEESGMSKTDSESSLSDPQSTCDRVPLLPN